MRLPTVLLSCVGRFHHFHLARQLSRSRLLARIVTAYPMFKLGEEHDIPKDRITTFPWLHAPYMMLGQLGFPPSNEFEQKWRYASQVSLDLYASTKTKGISHCIALSGNGEHTGRKVQLNGGVYICDRGSTHIRHQRDVLEQELCRWGAMNVPVPDYVVEKEEVEYNLADMITVPSDYVRKTFIGQGVQADKVRVIPYGANLQRFSQITRPPASEFNIIFVGQVGFRKGFLYLLDAFSRLRHPRKKLVVIGPISAQIRAHLSRWDLSRVHFFGSCPNSEIAKHYSNSHVMVLPSIEEGLAMVIGEALACGCPVIVTANTGAENIMSHREEGYIVPSNSADAILASLEELVDDSNLREEMSARAIQRVKSLGGWNNYGDLWTDLLISEAVA